MKYRTVIELVCEASDREEAGNIAGDYLRGDIDFGVDMICRTTSMATYKVKRYAVTCLMTFFVFLAFLFNVTPVASHVSSSDQGSAAFRATSTVTPSLRTQYAPDFKEEWREEQERAILEYLKRD